MSGESSVRELRATGLQGVSLGETEIALVDGENGRLIYRGHDAEQLAHESTFEATAFLLWNGRLPDDAELAELRQRAVAGMVVPARGARRDPRARRHRAADGRPAHAASRSGARCARAPRAATARTPLGAGGDAGDRRRLRPAARRRRVLAPDPELGIVENYLLKLSGERPRRHRRARSTPTSSSAPSTA